MSHSKIIKLNGEQMHKSENVGLLATAALLLVLFFLGYYGNQKEEISINTSEIKDEQQAINKELHEY
jgi:hypothetical protein